MHFTPDNAREQALRDWQSQSVVNLVVGTIDISLPRYHWGELFCTESVSCDWSEEAELFCRTYNLTIRSLLKKHGIPSWAPAKRLPDAVFCLNMLHKEGLPFAGHRPVSKQEESAANRILFHWGSERPVIYARLASSLLVWGGSLSDQSGRVDVLDLLNHPQWLAFYTYPRAEFSQLPWDELVESLQ
jgi:hypothetical protein